MKTEKYEYFVIEEKSEFTGDMYYSGGHLFAKGIYNAKTYGIEQLADYDIKRYGLKNCSVKKVTSTFIIE